MESGNGDEMENENGDEGGDGDGDRDDLDQELPSWLQYPCAGTIPASTQHQTPLALFGHSGPLRAAVSSTPASPAPQTLTGMHASPPRSGKY